MPTLEQEQEKREELEEHLSQLSSIDPKSLIRREELGTTFSFQYGLPTFERTLDLFKRLSEVDLTGMPFEILNELANHASQARQYLQQIQEFEPRDHANAGETRDTFIDQLQNAWNSYYRMVTPHIAYALREGLDVDALERQASDAVTEAERIVVEIRNTRDQIVGDMESALEQVKSAAAEAGVAQHAVHFKDEADEHRKRSYAWLGGAIVSAVATGGYAFYALGNELNAIALDASVARVIQLALPRLVIISLLTYALVWCGRNYNASRHNFVINRHRQNALSSFETFVQAASDQQTKETVLIQATQSIFAPQPSGFLKGEVETQQGSQLFGFVRDLTGSGE